MEVIKSKVKTKYVSIEGREFVLMEYTLDNDSVMYGTIPYTNIDDKGQMIKGMNGLEMCLSQTIGGALDMRYDLIKCEEMTEEEIFAYFKKKIEQAKGKA